jgi:hypothetical protein
MKIEVWKSDDNQEERHYFLEEDGSYLFGYNPKYFSEREINIILEELQLRLIFGLPE